jgi:hypothetical protein
LDQSTTTNLKYSNLKGENLMQTITKETLKQELDRLNDEQLKQIADFIAFIKFQSKLSQPKPDLNQFAHLYQEFADEDRELTEMGMSEYTKSLEHEDQL